MRLLKRLDIWLRPWGEYKATVDWNEAVRLSNGTYVGLLHSIPELNGIKSNESRKIIILVKKEG